LIKKIREVQRDELIRATTSGILKEILVTKSSVGNFSLFGNIKLDHLLEEYKELS
jgi:hypothetical protein